MAPPFLAHGGPLGMLGTPVGPARRRDGGAWSRDYRSTIKPRATCAQPDNGAPTTLHSAIYFSPGTGAHVVSGAILASWRDFRHRPCPAEMQFTAADGSRDSLTAGCRFDSYASH